MTDYRILTRLMAASFCLLAALPAQAQKSDPENPPDCLQLTPGAVSVNTTAVTLNLRIVLDGVAMERATQALTDAQKAYTPLNISINPSYQFVSFTNRDSAALIAEAKGRFGGERPAGTDAVYVMTAKDLTTDGTDNSVAGQADCIGGIAFSDKAFAVGEALEDSPLSAGVVVISKLNAAKVLGHELGHLLGAHHHYANCGEAAGGGDAPCTLMFNDVSLQALKFSTVNSSVVRGAAQEYVGASNTGGSSGGSSGSSGGVTGSSSSGGSSGISGSSSGSSSSGSGNGGNQGSGGGGGGGLSWLISLPFLLLARRRRV